MLSSFSPILFNRQLLVKNLIYINIVLRLLLYFQVFKIRVLLIIILIILKKVIYIYIYKKHTIYT